MCLTKNTPLNFIGHLGVLIVPLFASFICITFIVLRLAALFFLTKLHFIELRGSEFFTPPTFSGFTNESYEFSIDNL